MTSHGDGSRRGTGAATVRVDTIDGVRAIAASVVLLFHVASASGRLDDDSQLWRIIGQGGVGVPIFFVLSGMLLYRPWVRRLLDDAPGPPVRVYFRRRALRVLPGYWLVLVVALVAFSTERVGSARTWIEWLTLTQIYDPSPWWPWLGAPGLSPIWSLATELSFYLALPPLALGLASYARRGGGGPERRAGRLLIGTGALVGSSLAWTVVVRLVADSDTRLYLEQWLPRWLCCFGAGMALAVLIEWERSVPSGRTARTLRTIGATPSFGWTLALTALVVVATPIGTAFTTTETTPGQYVARAVLHLVVAVALVAPVAFGHRSAVLGNPVMRFLGRISFGVFLWHSVVIEAWSRAGGRPDPEPDFWTLTVVVVPVTLLLSTITYVAVERPALALAGRGRDRAPEPEPESVGARRASGPGRSGAAADPTEPTVGPTGPAVDPTGPTAGTSRAAGTGKADRTGTGARLGAASRHRSLPVGRHRTGGRARGLNRPFLSSRGRRRPAI